MGSIMRSHVHARAFIGAAILAASTLFAAYGLAAPNEDRGAEKMTRSVSRHNPAMVQLICGQPEQQRRIVVIGAGRSVGVSRLFDPWCERCEARGRVQRP